jgi:metallo-beta-lactamase class B
MKSVFLGLFGALLACKATAVEMTPGLRAMAAPQKPFQITDEIYYVGAQDATAFLIDGGDGLILTDGAFPQNAPEIAANIKALGFDIRNVKVLLNSHAHFDHAGGLAELKQLSGAKLYASRGDAPVLESGGAADFMAKKNGYDKKPAFPPVPVDVRIDDGAKVRVARAELTLHVTPGHTRGCTSWTMTAHAAASRRTCCSSVV